MKLLVSILSLFILFTSCSSSSVKEKIQQVGDVAGQTAGELAKGIGNGVSKSFEAKIEVSETLQKKGISLGKISVSSDTVGTDNLLSVYVIFSEDYAGTLISKAFDEKSLEMGRATLSVEGKKGEAKYIDFHFDKRTNIDNNSKLTIE